MGNWRRILSMILAVLLAVSCLAGILPHAFAEDVAAETTVPEIVEEMPVAEAAGEMVTVTADVDLPSSEELFAKYAEQKLYPNPVAPFGTAAGERLDSSNKAMYDYLKEKVSLVAEGKLESTSFTFTEAELKAMGVRTSWSMEELGVSAIIANGGQITEEAKEALGAAFTEGVDTGVILPALLSDCPYEMYWSSKGMGSGWSMGASYSYEHGCYYYMNIKRLTINMYVGTAFSAGTTTSVNTAKTSAAAKAAANAKTIVAKYAGKSDYEKLLGYKNEICAMVDYDHPAANNHTFNQDSNPWQLINVFDGNPDTMVVCEGYAKAFQYLCDLSTFTGDVTCYNVSGVMSGGTGAGPHMWNIVTIGGQNYLVDVTNSDEGSVGEYGGLFLAGNKSGSVTGGYTFPVDTGVTFTYDPEELSQWDTGDDSILKLAAEDFDPDSVQEPVDPEEAAKLEKLSKADVTGDGSVNEGDAVYLLWYTLMPQMFPIDESLDLDVDGVLGITDGDALELLWYAVQH